MKNVKFGTMMLLPPAKDKCQICAVEHDPRNPHNAQSMYYQTKFGIENDKRSATWADAMAHCDDITKSYWEEHLNFHGIDINGSVYPHKEQADVI